MGNFNDSKKNNKPANSGSIQWMKQRDLDKKGKAAAAKQRHDNVMNATGRGKKKKS